MNISEVDFGNDSLQISPETENQVLNSVIKKLILNFLAEQNKLRGKKKEKKNKVQKDQIDDVEDQADAVEDQADDVESQADDVEDQADAVEDQAEDMSDKTGLSCKIAISGIENSLVRIIVKPVRTSWLVCRICSYFLLTDYTPFWYPSINVRVNQRHIFCTYW